MSQRCLSDSYETLHAFRINNNRDQLIQLCIPWGDIGANTSDTCTHATVATRSPRGGLFIMTRLGTEPEYKNHLGLKHLNVNNGIGTMSRCIKWIGGRQRSNLVNNIPRDFVKRGEGENASSFAGSNGGSLKKLMMKLKESKRKPLNLLSNVHYQKN